MLRYMACAVNIWQINCEMILLHANTLYHSMSQGMQGPGQQVSDAANQIDPGGIRTEAGREIGERGST